MYVIVAMTIDGYFGVLIMNVVNSIVRIPIKDFIGILTLTLVRSPMQSSTKDIDQSAVRFQSGADDLMINIYITL